MNAAPKRKPKSADEEKDEPEDMKPVTMEEKAKDLLPELLADAAKCRTESIKLASIPYASELSQQLLQQAAKLEGYYKSIVTCLKDQVDDKVLKSWVKKVGDANAFTLKAQA